MFLSILIKIKLVCFEFLQNGKKKDVVKREIGKIKAYKECGLNISQIANKIGRTRCVVSNYLRNASNYGKNTKGGTYTVLSALDRRAIIRSASNSQDSAAKIKEKTGVKASLATVKRVIQKATNFK